MALQSNSDWASLPDDLLNSILDHFAPVEECIRFSIVCSEWRRVACENFEHPYCNIRYLHPHQHQLPFLMVPAPDNNVDKRSLYDVSRKSLFEFQLKVPHNARCCGSSHGWLIFMNDYFEVTLFNPFSGKAIHLPPIKRLGYEKLSDLQLYKHDKQFETEIYDDSVEREESDQDEQEPEAEDDEYEKEESELIDQEFESQYLILRGVLSANPELNPNEYILMVIYGKEKRLAFFKSGDKNWTYIDKYIYDSFKATYYSIPCQQCLRYWSDIVYRNGLFYALNNWGGVLLSCDVGKTAEMKRVTGVDEEDFAYNKKAYLVESSEGDFLCVIRVYDARKRTTEKFVVYELEDSFGNLEWTEVVTLGDVALFLGDNHSTSILASEFYGCQRDSIYFCDDSEWIGEFFHDGPPKDFKVYNLQDGRITRHCARMAQHYSYTSTSPSIWISPTFL